MKQEFEQRKEMEVVGADQEEVHAVRFVKSWHRFPVFHDAIWYRGINLGEADEYILVNPILKALLKQSGKMSQ